MNKDQEFLRRAIELATESVNKGGGPFGAVVVKDDKIIGEGYNQVTMNMDPTAHAEVNAIRNACQNIKDFNLDGATMYTSCEPCPMCLSAIYWSRMSRIVFGNSRSDAAAIDFDDSYIYEQVNLELDKRDIPTSQMLPDEANHSFKIWSESLEKVPY